MNAILGYSEMWLEDADELGLHHAVPTLTAVHRAGSEALSRVSTLVDLRRLGADFDPEFELGALGDEVKSSVWPGMAPVRGWLNTLSDMPLPDTFAEADAFLADLDRIGRAAERLGQLLHDVFQTDSPHTASRAMVTAEVARFTPNSLEPLSGHVLVVDDNPGNRDVLKRRLERMGCEVDLAASGPEALDKLDGLLVDVVLLDVLMPEMSGIEVLQAIKGRADITHLPVIMISALDQLDSVVHCLELGAEDYLPKPFNPVILRARVSASLTRKRARDQEMAWQRQLESEKRRADALLHAIFPDRIVAELKGTGEVQARNHANVAVLFCDIVGFTDHCARHPPGQVRDQLQELTEALEELCLAFSLEKIKTIGDAFMAASGLIDDDDPLATDRAVRCGLEMIRIAPTLSSGWQVRVAIHTGPVIAGVVGRRKYQYDLWGDTVNTAARIEGLTQPGELWASSAVAEQLGPDWQARSLGTHALKGRGRMELVHIARPPARR